MSRALNDGDVHAMADLVRLHKALKTNLDCVDSSSALKPTLGHVPTPFRPPPLHRARRSLLPVDAVASSCPPTENVLSSSRPPGEGVSSPSAAYSDPPPLTSTPPTMEDDSLTPKTSLTFVGRSGLLLPSFEAPMVDSAPLNSGALVSPNAPSLAAAPPSSSSTSLSANALAASNYACHTPSFFQVLMSGNKLHYSLESTVQNQSVVGLSS
ncbi:hypothetical protein Salat_2118500 [Sesamum alatum]|uniref:Uncharacterized protein n=1 Tax=Sesamum alatum TaxID=300844 RepID=A0AAE1Y1V2_9LAMI|nr:hypothetical protein Salat_2118500 [Sesamum alatum]